MRTLMISLAVALAAFGSSVATATTILFSGGGSVSRSQGPLPATGTAPVGSGFGFAFTFDLDDTTFVTNANGTLVYRLPVTNFVAQIGGYSFVPLTGIAAINIGQGLSFFGQPYSEPARLFSFSIAGSAGPDAPFDLGTGARADRLTFTVGYRDPDPSRAPSLGDIVDPASLIPANRSFNYTGSSGPFPAPTGNLSGIFVGGFVSADIPEPAQWTLLILGFGVVGARRRLTVLAA